MLEALKVPNLSEYSVNLCLERSVTFPCKGRNVGSRRRGDVGE